MPGKGALPNLGGSAVWKLNLELLRDLENVPEPQYIQCVTGLTCGQGKRRGLTSWACAAGFCLVWGWSAFSAFAKCKLPNSAASSRPEGSGWTLHCPFYSCICNWSGPWISLHSCSSSRVFPGDGTSLSSSSQGRHFFFATTMQDYSCISVCPEVNSAEVFSFKTHSSGLQIQPFLQQSSSCFVGKVSVVHVLCSLPWLQSTSGEPPVLSSQLMFCWVCGSSHNVQHRLHKSELWVICVLWLQSTWWYDLCLHFLVALEECYLRTWNDKSYCWDQW